MVDWSIAQQPFQRITKRLLQLNNRSDALRIAFHLTESNRLFAERAVARNKYFDAAIWGSVGLQVLTMFVPPLRNFLGVVRPGLADIGVIAASSLLPLAVNELTKGKETRKE